MTRLIFLHLIEMLSELVQREKNLTLEQREMVFDFIETIEMELEKSSSHQIFDHKNSFVH